MSIFGCPSDQNGNTVECRVPFTLWFDSHSKYCAGRHAWAQEHASLLMLVETVVNIFLNLKTF